jgi:hypothetical protein
MKNDRVLSFLILTLCAMPCAPCPIFEGEILTSRIFLQLRGYFEVRQTVVISLQLKEKVNYVVAEPGERAGRGRGGWNAELGMRKAEKKE